MRQVALQQIRNLRLFPFSKRKKPRIKAMQKLSESHRELTTAQHKLTSRKPATVLSLVGRKAF